MGDQPSREEGDALDSDAIAALQQTTGLFPDRSSPAARSAPDAEAPGRASPAASIPGSGKVAVPGVKGAAPGLQRQQGQSNGDSSLCEPALMSQLVQTLGSRPRNQLLLSDLGALLPGNMRHGVKEKGGLRSWLQKYPELFSVSGAPGKESVTLTIGGLCGPSAADTSEGAKSLPAPVGPVHLQQGQQQQLQSNEQLEMQKRLEEEENEGAVQLRGLPYRATMADVKNFLGPYVKFLKDDPKAIQLVLNRDGRPSGFGKVQLTSPEAARVVRDAKHMHRMEVQGGKTEGERGERYVEIFLFADRPNKLRFKKTLTEIGVEAENDFDVGSLGVSKEQVLEECQAHMRQPGKGKVLLSMLGVALSPGARLYLKKTDQGLKHFLATYPEEFKMEGSKGRELIIYLPAVPSDPGNTNEDIPEHFKEKAQTTQEKEDKLTVQAVEEATTPATVPASFTDPRPSCITMPSSPGVGFGSPLPPGSVGAGSSCASLGTRRSAVDAGPAKGSLRVLGREKPSVDFADPEPSAVTTALSPPLRQSPKMMQSPKPTRTPNIYEDGGSALTPFGGHPGMATPSDWGTPQAFSMPWGENKRGARTPNLGGGAASLGGAEALGGFSSAADLNNFAASAAAAGLATPTDPFLAAAAAGLAAFGTPSDWGTPWPNSGTENNKRGARTPQAAAAAVSSTAAAAATANSAGNLNFKFQALPSPFAFWPGFGPQIADPAQVDPIQAALALWSRGEASGPSPAAAMTTPGLPEGLFGSLGASGLPEGWAAGLGLNTGGLKEANDFNAMLQNVRQQVNGSMPPLSASLPSMAAETPTCDPIQQFLQSQAMQNQVNIGQALQSLGLAAQQQPEEPRHDAPPQTPDRNEGACLRLRGLPYEAQEQDILAWFAKFDCVERIADVPQAVRIYHKSNGKPMGLAVVTMQNYCEADYVLKKLNNLKMGSRYIEVFHHQEGEAGTDKACIAGATGGTGGNESTSTRSSPITKSGDTGGSGSCSSQANLGVSSAAGSANAAAVAAASYPALAAAGNANAAAFMAGLGSLNLNEQAGALGSSPAFGGLGPPLQMPALGTGFPSGAGFGGCGGGCGLGLGLGSPGLAPPFAAAAAAAGGNEPTDLKNWETLFKFLQTEGNALSAPPAWPALAAQLKPPALDAATMQAALAEQRKRELKAKQMFEMESRTKPS